MDRPGKLSTRAPRLFVTAALARGAEVPLDKAQSHYALHVLRLKGGDPVRLFNGQDGEWLAYLTGATKKAAQARCERMIGEAVPPPDLDFVFAPLKHARLDYVVQKATELGARRLVPVITERTVTERVNLDRMRANAIEAAEQCNLTMVPQVLVPRALDAVLKDWDPARTLIHCDETAAVGGPLAALRGLAMPAAALVGPEGGFTDAERTRLRALPFTLAIALGPRIMRADTAGIAVMALVQATVGDWT